MSAPAPLEPSATSIGGIAERIGADVAAAYADKVDSAAAFPRESIEALRGARLLGALVPRELGGLGATLEQICEACTALGRHCANTAMVFAMHQIQVACLMRHALQEPFFREYAAEALAGRQELIASATTEAGVGGDVRTSLCAVVRNGERFDLEKNAPVISYGAEADAILATARRAPDAANGDQQIVLLRKADYRLEQTSSWDTLGFRGTCSNGYLLKGAADVRQIVPGAYADISAQTMLPVSHLTWSSLWLGIALDAFARAGAFVRSEARKQPGKVPPGALRLAELSPVVQGFRANVRDCLREYEAVQGARGEVGMGFALRMNNLKVAASQLVVQIVSQAMLICGIAGYKQDSKFALGRHLRDAYGAALMINNDRIFGASAQMLLVYKDL